MEENPYKYQEKRFFTHAKKCEVCKKVLLAPLINPRDPVPDEKLCRIGKVLRDDAIKEFEKGKQK